MMAVRCMALLSLGSAAAWRSAGRAAPVSRLSLARLPTRLGAGQFRLHASSRLSAPVASATVNDAPSAQCPVLAGQDAEDMPKTYEHGQVEQPLYRWWEDKGFFKPKSDTCAADGSDPEDDTFTISMPPPNVTGYLHMGHALFVALQDIMIRWNRMRGKNTLWVPGTDHAGIATQMLVDRQLQAEGISRLEIGREAFVDKVWEWKEQKGGYITGQIRRLGASCDWERERFTLEPEMSAAVTEAFVRLHERGLVYKGDYMCNWSPELQTAVSDLEVNYSEEMGKLYTFKYMLAGGDGDEHIAVATTRPETILGDTALCVHPEDDRYKAFVGRKARVPFVDREIPVIADDYVDREFGTGALKITPAHDVNDYEIGKRHDLPVISVMNKDATINDQGGKYAGLDRYEARERLWADMEAAGLAISVKDHMQRVPRSERSGEVIEPLVSTQWFVRAGPLAKPALDKVRSGEVKIIPKRFEKVYYNWLDNIQDWCISRQLWWGHRIPVWYARDEAGEERAFVARSEAEALAQAKEALGKEDVALTQDPDVLDTWFSSGLWPFNTLGWPNDTPDLRRFYPTQVMETGYDILFFWVARMMMMGIELTGQAPFHTVYMHGLVRDEKGQKMSKTKGNVVDPLEAIDTYGTDALRYTLVTGSTPGQDIPLSTERLLTNRNLCNKLWNTCRFIVTGPLAGLSPEALASLRVSGPMGADELAAMPLPERYIVSRLHELARQVTENLEECVLGAAGSAIARFLWDEFADWYIEVSKTRLQGASPDDPAAATARRALVYVLDSSLRLLHPYMPYVTEALWQRLPHEGETIMRAKWPQMPGDPPLAVDDKATAQFALFQDTVRAMRNARAEYKVEPGKKIPATVCVADADTRARFEEEKAALALLARADPGALAFSGDLAAPSSGEKMVHLVVADGVEVFLPLAGLVDFAQERKRLEKQAAKLEASIDKIQGRLSAPGFVDKAPAHVVEQARTELSEQQEQLGTVRKSIAELPDDDEESA